MKENPWIIKGSFLLTLIYHFINRVVEKVEKINKSDNLAVKKAFLKEKFCGKSFDTKRKKHLFC